MEDWIEIEGSTKRDAIDRACDALNTNESHLEFEVIAKKQNVTKIRARKVEEGQDLDEVEETEHRAKPKGRNIPKVVATSFDDDQYDDEREDEEDESDEPEVVHDPEAGNRAKEMLLTVLKHIDDEAEVELTESRDEIYLDMRGSETGRFIGKHGQTLTALQHLISKMAGLDKSGKRVVVDAEQYLERREESLRELAQKLASRAKRGGRPVNAQPMNSLDRRILHMELAEDPSVSTKSVGDGDQRRVMVVPKRRGGNGGGRDRNRGRGRGNSGGRDRDRDRGGNNTNRDRDGNRGGRDRQERIAEPRRRSGPPPRMHDSFDAPPEPENVFFEDPDAPVMDDDNTERVQSASEDKTFE